MKKSLRFAGLLLLVAVLLFGLTAHLYWQRARTRIMPGVAVHGIALGGMTVTEAAAVLTRGLPAPEVSGVTLNAAGQTWRLSWVDVGQRYDVVATAEAAYAVGRDRRGIALWLASLREHNVSLQPVTLAPDPGRVKAYLESIAEAVYIPPVDAQFSLDGARVIASPGQEGQRLDLEAGVERVMAALREGDAEVDLALAPIPPKRPEPEPARSRAEAWLSRPFVLTIDDVLTGEPPEGYHAEFTTPPERVATWLMPSEGTQDIQLYVNATTGRAWLKEVESLIGEERLLDMDTTFRAVLQALYAGQHQAQGHVRHPESVYTVQPGDTLSLIAYEHHFPVWQLKKANPDVEPGAINVGQQITIPSLDVLFPHPLVPGKRIEIDLSIQQMRVYENDAQIFTFTVSSGISRTPTLDGQYQILFKEESAFARRWQLDMPYFMGIYEEDDGFYNGIHELPITSYGVRLSRSVLGWPASFGCIIVDEGDAETLFKWAEVGTLVRIEGFAPGTPTWQETLADLAPLEGEP